MEYTVEVNAEGAQHRKSVFNGWTKDAPTEEGYYWADQGEGFAPCIVKVETPWGTELAAVQTDSDIFQPLSYFERWIGLLPMPPKYAQIGTISVTLPDHVEGKKSAFMPFALE